MGAISILIVAGIVGIWAYAIIDIIRSDFKSTNKGLWIFIVLFFGMLGVLIYLFAGPEKVKATKKESEDILDDL